MRSSTSVLFHITTRAAWDAAVAAGVYRPASLAREGFIHLSTDAQWPRTLARFFAGQDDLVLLAIDPERLGAEVRFEVADGDSFPHLYGPLAPAAVVGVEPLGDLDRFVEAQAQVHATALAELRAGAKRSHWMWFVFPQLVGLGRSAMATRYGIVSLAEARAYLAHPVLGPRYRACVDALARLPASATAESVLGGVDAIKLRSSLTLFAAADPTDARLADALARWFGGAADPATTARLTR